MKRKLNDDNVPEAVVGKKFKQDPELPSVDSFEALDLAPQLLQAVIAHKFSSPTPVQARVIPAVFAGRDVLARSKTGSGKTAAYVLPILQSILGRKLSSARQTKTKTTTALILVPTRELASQVSKVVASFSSYCANDITVENLSRKEDERVTRARVAAQPDIIVSTAGRAAAHIIGDSLSLDHVTTIVIDEADLVLTYGDINDLQAISRAKANGCQVILMSATLREEVTSLEKLFCNDPTIITLDEVEQDDGKVSQHIVKCAEDEKFLLAYAIFVLKLIKGKTIIFVGDIDRCYRLKLFLEQFGIKSCVLNSELPVNSRIHVVEQFNRNAYDIIIATDENEVIGQEHLKRSSKKAKHDEPDETESVITQTNTELRPEHAESASNVKDEAQPAKKKRKSVKTDKDYGVARGIDFKNVSCVLNFDLPPSSKSYIHRIGRTARAGKTGMALSFVIPKDQYRKHKWTSIPSCANDEDTLEKITKAQTKLGNTIEPYAFDMVKLDGFRYRLADALKSVTPGAIREARVRELRNELIKSEKLKRHFEENPDELKHLRHDGALRPAKVRPYMRNVPGYMLPGAAKQTLEAGGIVRLNKPMDERRKRRGHFKKKPAAKTKVNPLQSFKARR